MTTADKTCCACLLEQGERSAEHENTWTSNVSMCLKELFWSPSTDWQKKHFILTATAAGNTNGLWLLGLSCFLTFLVSWPKSTIQNVLSYIDVDNRHILKGLQCILECFPFISVMMFPCSLKEIDFYVNLYLGHSPLILMEELISSLYLPTKRKLKN